MWKLHIARNFKLRTSRRHLWIMKPAISRSGAPMTNRRLWPWPNCSRFAKFRNSSQPPSWSVRGEVTESCVPCVHARKKRLLMESSASICKCIKLLVSAHAQGRRNGASAAADENSLRRAILEYGFVFQSRRLVVSFLCASAVERCPLSSQFSLPWFSFTGKKKREKITSSSRLEREPGSETHFYTDPVSDIQCRLEEISNKNIVTSETSFWYDVRACIQRLEQNTRSPIDLFRELLRTSH